MTQPTQLSFEKPLAQQVFENPNLIRVILLRVYPSVPYFAFAVTYTSY